MGLEDGGKFCKDDVPSPSPSDGAAIKDVTFPPIVEKILVLVHYNIL